MPQCPNHPASRMCPECDPNSSAYRAPWLQTSTPAVPSAPVSPSRAAAKPMSWLQLGALIIAAPFVLFFGLVVFGVAITVLWPFLGLVPFIIIGLVMGNARRQYNEQLVKATVDYAAVRLAQELAARR